MSADPLVARLRRAGCVFAEEEAVILRGAAGDESSLEALVRRRVAGEPLEHVVGWSEVGGRRIGTAHGVFVPRRRTALLVREALSRLPRNGVLVDVCCGAGVVAVVVARSRPDVEVHACDLDPAAVVLARRNLVGTRASVHEGDLLEALPVHLRGRVDVVAANAPYVPSAELSSLPVEARAHEPALALDGGPDGAHLHRRLAATAPDWLTPRGTLLVETGGRTAGATQRALEHRGLRTFLARDEALSAQVAVGSR